MKIYSFIILVLIFSIASLYAQKESLYFEHLASEEGLSHNTVYSIIQDHQGFMWFGTPDGLNKYDGYDFTIWENDPNDSASIPNRNTGNLFIDADGIIWIGSWGGGLIKFNPITEKFEQFLHDSNNPYSISGNRIQSLFKDKSGSYWFGTYKNGLNKYDPKTKQFKHYKHDSNNINSLSNNRVWSIVEGQDGKLWIGTDNGLDYFDIESESFIHYKHDEGNNLSLSHSSVRTLHHTSSGNLWIGTRIGLNLFDSNSKTFLRYFHDENNSNSIIGDVINTIYEDKDSVLWIGTTGGLSRFNLKNNSFNNDFSAPFNPNSLSNDFIRSIYEDTNGTMWIGTNGGGINKFSKTKRKFIYYSRTFDESNSLSNNNVRIFFEDDFNNLWIGTGGGGLNKFNLATGKFVHFKHNSKILNTLTSNNISSIEICDSESIWVGSGEGLNKFNIVTNKVINYPHPLLSDIRIMKKDHFENLWIGTYKNGLLRFNKSTQTFTHFDHDPNDSTSLGYPEVWAILEDSEKRLWIGTGDGLDKFDFNSEEFIHYKHSQENSNSLLGSEVRSLFESASGNLWVGTNEGLNKFDRTTGVFKHFSIEDGLPNNSINGILEDENSCLWLSTNQGLSKFDTQTNTFSNYDTDDGLQGKEFNVNAALKGKNGILYFGGSNGFNSFKPDQVIDNDTPPPVKLTSFSKFGESVKLEKSISYTKEIELSYDDKMFSFEFAALDFAAPQKNKYAYKMEGLKDEWIYTDYKNRRVSFTGLPNGEYTFRVKASNNDGYWNDVGTSINIIILPAWWATIWFRIIAFIFIVTVLPSIYFWRTRRLRRRKEALEAEINKRKEIEKDLIIARENSDAANKAKSDFLANVSHELRTPLNIISGNNQLLKMKLNDNHLTKYITIIENASIQLTQLINNILDFSKTDAIKLVVDDFNVNDILNKINKLLSKLAKAKDLTLKFDSDASIPSVLRGDAKLLLHALILLVDNAIKFSSNGEIVIAMKQINMKDDSYKINFIVKDCGIGIAEDKIDQLFNSFTQIDGTSTRKYGGLGLGLSLCDRIVKSMGGKILVNSEVDKGSTFSFELNLAKSEKSEIDNKFVDHFAEEVDEEMIGLTVEDSENSVSEKEEEKSILSDEEVEVKLAELKTMLEDYDAQSVDKIKEIGLIEGFENEMKNLENKVSEYDFDEGLEILIKIIEEIE